MVREKIEVNGIVVKSISKPRREITETESKHIEIEVNGIVVGYLIVGLNNKINHTEIYQPGMFSKEDFETTLKFLEYLKKYEWNKES